MTREPPNGHPDLHGLRLLVMEDDPQARGVLLDLLQPVAAKVTSAAEGLEAVLGVPLDGIDIALIDVSRPAADGRGLLEAIRRRHPRVRTVALAGPSAGGLFDAAMDSGADAFAQAPYTPERLLGVIASALARGEADRTAPPPPRGTILAASMDGALLHVLEAVSQLYGHVFVPAASAFQACEVLKDMPCRIVVVDEQLADGPGECLVESLPLFLRRPRVILVKSDPPRKVQLPPQPSYVEAVELRRYAAISLRRMLGAA
jgi:DNA-binding NtrC family response regulator